MKDTVAAVIGILKADTAVKAVVQTRIYRGEDIPDTPQKPFISVIWPTPRVPWPPTSSSTLATDRIQCTSFETSGAKAAILSDLIGLALSWEKVENTVVNGVEISAIDDQGGCPDNSDAKTTKEFRDNHDFKITYRLR